MASRRRRKSGKKIAPIRNTVRGRAVLAREPRRLWRIGIAVMVTLVAVGLATWAQRFQIPAAAPHGTVPDVTELTPELRTYIQYFRDAIEADPDRAGAHAQLGVVYEANELWEEAKVCFQTAMRLDSGDVLSPYHLGIVTHKLGDAESAVEYFLEAVKRDPAFAPAHQRLGDLHLETGDLPRAARAFQKVIDLVPKEQVGQVGLASVQLRQGNYASAVTLLEACVQAQPRVKTPYYLLGLAYRGLGREAEALEAMKKGAVSQKLFLQDPWTQSLPRHTPGMSLATRLKRIEELIGIRDYQSAAELLKYARAWYPENTEVLNKLGAVYFALGSPDKAEGPFRAAERIDGANAKTLASLASCLTRLGRHREALAYAERAALLAPDAAAPLITKAQILIRLAEYEEAASALQDALRLAPGRLLIHKELANVYLLLDRFDEAGRHYRTALAKDPDFLEGHLGLVRVYSRTGEIEQAMDHLEAARRMAPQHPQVIAFTNQLRASRD